MGLHADFKCNLNQDGTSQYRSITQILKKKREVGNDQNEQLDEEENVTDQFLRDSYDVMSFYATNMLCEAFTDIKKFRLSENELKVEKKVTELYLAIEDLCQKEECDTVEKINSTILKQSINYRAQ